MTKEDAFLLGLFYSGGYKNKDQNMDFSFKNSNMEKFFIYLLEKNNIRYEKIKKGIVYFIKIPDVKDIENFISRYSLKIEDIIYHSIPNVIYQNKDLSLYFVFGILEMCSIFTKDIVKILVDSFIICDYIEQILKWKSPELEMKKSITFLPNNTQGVVISIKMNDIKNIMKDMELSDKIKFSI